MAILSSLATRSAARVGRNARQRCARAFDIKNHVDHATRTRACNLRRAHSLQREHWRERKKQKK